MLLIILGTSFAAGSAIGFLLAKYAAPWLLYFVWAALTVFIVCFSVDPVMDLLGLPDNGYDRIGFFALAMLFAAPALIGCLGVGLATLVQRRRREQDEGGQ